VNGRNEKLQAAETAHEAAKKRAKDAVCLTLISFWLRHCTAMQTVTGWQLMLLCVARL
jgi:hypothetical protein